MGLGREGGKGETQAYFRTPEQRAEQIIAPFITKGRAGNITGLSQAIATGLRQVKQEVWKEVAKRLEPESKCKRCGFKKCQGLCDGICELIDEFHRRSVEGTDG